MKIKVKKIPYNQAMLKSKAPHKPPKKPNILFRSLVRLLSIPELMAVKFKYTEHNMEKAGEGPFLILMNHSSFIDLKIASKILYPMPYGIICTSDGFVGKEWLMRNIGCIPTQKFVTDAPLVKDIIRALWQKNMSILMYPEASYSFDGCATPLPRHLGKLIKKLDVSILTIITDGAFLYDPLYNGLQRRKTKITARLSCLASKEEIRGMTVEQINSLLDKEFSFNHFAAQSKVGPEISEGFRADGLHRILYRCPECQSEGEMEGSGTKLRCKHCGKSYFMDTLGRLKADSGDTRFELIPDWYAWQRECIKEEIEKGSYLLDTEVDIALLRDFKAIYKVGSGRLIHDKNGFTLSGCEGELNYSQPPLASYGLYADYFWYEIGDVICIGNNDTLYYCFPKNKTPVAKARLAAEEMYKMIKSEKISAL